MQVVTMGKRVIQKEVLAAPDWLGNGVVYSETPTPGILNTARSRGFGTFHTAAKPEDTGIGRSFAGCCDISPSNCVNYVQCRTQLPSIRYNEKHDQETFVVAGTRDRCWLFILLPYRTALEMANQAMDAIAPV